MKSLSLKKSYNFDNQDDLFQGQVKFTQMQLTPYYTLVLKIDPKFVLTTDGKLHGLDKLDVDVGFDL